MNIHEVYRDNNICIFCHTDCGPEPTGDKDFIEEQCGICNDKKDKAKRCSELSSEMFFAIFVRVSHI